MPTDSWMPFQPSDRTPWNLRRVVHLHRRAGFAATRSELQRDLKDGPQASVHRLLHVQARSAGVPDGFDATAKLLAESAVNSNDPARLKAWWVYRMAFGPDPLAERLTLLWHDHFATSNLKVGDLGLIHRQNETFRRLARAPFGDLLRAAVHEPALLVWLDAPANRKGHPNENLARESMELFTLGLGPFSESDVKDAARALTGWSVEDGNFVSKSNVHDTGAKAILGRTGPWTGDDFVGILLEHPATADRLAARLCSMFFGEGQPSQAERSALADRLRANNLDVGGAVETILRSQLFFADANLNCRVPGPVESVVGVVRALEMFDPPPSTLALADWAARLGQDLFYPPNVGGWPGGRAWVTTRSAVGRANFAAALAAGPGIGRSRSLDAIGLARRYARGEDAADLIAFFGELLRGSPPAPAEKDRLLSALKSKTDEAAGARQAVALLVAAPEMLLA
jgi:uncharacterized protein (DUF1800 family)